MKILHKYVLRQICVVFFLCLVVFTFVLFMGNMLRIIDMMAKGVSGGIILKFLFLLLPFMFAYSIPMSLLTSVLLVFARLSADNEITAIRASGINLLFIIKPVILSALLIVPVCYYVNNNLRPNAIFAGRKLLMTIGIQEPLVNLTSGRFNEVFPNHVIYIGQRQGKTYNKVVVYKFEDSKLKNVIIAESGQFVYEKRKTSEDKDDKDIITFKLYNGMIEEIPVTGQETGKSSRIQFETYSIEFDIKGQIQDLSKLPKKEREMTNNELLQKVMQLNGDMYQSKYAYFFSNIKQEVSCLKTRIHNRIALSFSGLMFVMVGIPLGIKVHRSETSISAGISLMLVSIYYLLLTLGEVFQTKPELHPWIIMWVPNLLIFCIGVILMYKLLRK